MYASIRLLESMDIYTLRGCGCLIFLTMKSFKVTHIIKHLIGIPVILGCSYVLHIMFNISILNSP